MESSSAMLMRFLAKHWLCCSSKKKKATVTIGFHITSEKSQLKKLAVHLVQYSAILKNKLWQRKALFEIRKRKEANVHVHFETKSQIKNVVQTKKKNSFQATQL